MPEQTVIYLHGDGILPIAAAVSLRSQGYEALLSDSWHPGFLGGQSVGERFIDTGSVLIEETRDHGHLPVSEFADTIGDSAIGVRNPARDLFEWSGDRVREVKVSSVLANKLLPDFVISDRLDVLQTLGLFSSTEVEADLHPKEKATNLLGQLSLYDAARRLYSPEYAQWFIALIDSWFPNVSAEIPARFHRTIWAPLYWPESLRASELSASIGPVRFYCVDGQFATALRELGAKLSGRMNPNRRELSAKTIAVEIQPRSFRNFEGRIPWTTLALRSDTDWEPCVIHDLDHSGLFRMSINLGHSGLILVEGPTSTSRRKLLDRAQEILELYFLETSPDREFCENIGTELIFEKIVELRYPTLRTSTEPMNRDLPGRPRVERESVHSNSPFKKVLYHVMFDPPHNSINGQILSGLEIATDLKGMLS